MNANAATRSSRGSGNPGAGPMLDLLQRLEHRGASASKVRVRISPGRGKQAIESDLPEEVVRLLRDILSELARGNSVSVVASRTDLTTQQAAALLGVSRPHLVSLLDARKIPSYKIGTHRRVRRDDVITYRNKLDEAREKTLDDLAAHDQALGIMPR